MTPSNTSSNSIDKHFVGPMIVPDTASARPEATVANPSARTTKNLSANNDHDKIRVDSSHAEQNLLTDPAQPDPIVQDLIGRESWLRLHATDLIRRLQDWAAGLDAREATLNASYARQDLRERKFRLHQQEIEAQIAAHKQAAEDLRQRINASLRRLAFRDIESS